MLPSYWSGLAFDWRLRNLYFTNVDFVSIDGVAFGWHKIEVVNVDTGARKVLVTDAGQPRALHIDNTYARDITSACVFNDLGTYA